jgi:hypothetical protein
MHHRQNDFFLRSWNPFIHPVNEWTEVNHGQNSFSFLIRHFIAPTLIRAIYYFSVVTLNRAIFLLSFLLAQKGLYFLLPINVSLPK